MQRIRKPHAKSASRTFGCSLFVRRLAELRFKEAVGHSVMDEILAVRTQRAMILLADPARQINEISGLCGYLSPNAFRRIFKSETGLTPHAWRKAKFPTC